MTDDDDKLSIYAFDAQGDYALVMKWVRAELAVRCAKVLADIGNERRIIIVDGGDDIVFDWRNGEGVVFPTKDTPPNKRFTEEDRPRGPKYGG